MASILSSLLTRTVRLNNLPLAGTLALATIKPSPLLLAASFTSKSLSWSDVEKGIAVAVLDNDGNTSFKYDTTSVFYLKVKRFEEFCTNVKDLIKNDGTFDKDKFLELWQNEESKKLKVDLYNNLKESSDDNHNKFADLTVLPLLGKEFGLPPLSKVRASAQPSTRKFSTEATSNNVSDNDTSKTDSNEDKNQLKAQNNNYASSYLEILLNQTAKNKDAGHDHVEYDSFRQ